VSDDQQPEFRKPSEFYIIIFLNKLKIVENTKRKGTQKGLFACGQLSRQKNRLSFHWRVQSRREYKQKHSRNVV
jgi:hypothetical protein